MKSVWWIGLLSMGCVSSTFSANQTPTVSPIQLSGLPYTIELLSADTGSAVLPTLNSFAVGTEGGNWVFVAGRTNGRHDFTADELLNFPPANQNTDIWVYNPITKQSWSRSLNDASSGISSSVFNALSATNTQFAQQGSKLFLAGGYLYDSVTSSFRTYSTLTSLDLPGVVDWVKTGTGSLAASVRQTSDPALQVTGGELHIANGEALLVFGQNFDGPYTPGSNGIYTNQVRSFNIVETPSSLSIANVQASASDDAFRRRDLNVVEVVAPGGQPALVALSGVFTPSGGAWTVPVEISATGTPTMADPLAPETFKQGMNGFASAHVTLYSPTTQENHILLLGGISLITYNGTNFAADNNLPFTSQGSSIVRNAVGSYMQYLLGDIFPDILDSSTGDPLLLGAGSEFLLSPDVPLSNGLVNMDALAGPTLLGHVFGGIAAEQANFGATSASNLLFEVWYTPVPEPGAIGLVVTSVLGLALTCLRHRSKIKPGWKSAGR